MARAHSRWLGAKFVRSFVAVMLVTLLCACAARDPLVSVSSTTTSGNWKIERQIDRVTGAPMPNAFLYTRNSSHSSVAFPQAARLQLSCFKDRQPIVEFSFLFKVGSTRNAMLGYRFDEKPGHEPEVRILQDHTTVVIEETAEVAQFVNELAMAKVLYLRIRSLDAGRATAEFQVEGAPAAIEAALASCPVATAQTPPARAGAVSASR